VANHHAQIALVVGRLLWEFVLLLRAIGGDRFALATLTVSTLLRLGAAGTRS